MGPILHKVHAMGARIRDHAPRYQWRRNILSGCARKLLLEAASGELNRAGLRGSQTPTSQTSDTNALTEACRRGWGEGFGYAVLLGGAFSGGKEMQEGEKQNSLQMN